MTWLVAIGAVIVLAVLWIQHAAREAIREAKTSGELQRQIDQEQARRAWARDDRPEWMPRPEDDDLTQGDPR